jgi:predicted phage terminase large subunit-like protein
VEEKVKRKPGRPKQALNLIKDEEPVKVKVDPELELRKKIVNQGYNDLDFLDRTISPQTYYLPSPEVHKEWDTLLLDNSKTQVLIEAPRGTSKSTKVKAKVKHHITFDEGDKFVIIQSKTRPEAINRLTSIKNMLEYSKEYRSLFGYCGEQVAEIWREDKITTRIGGFRVTIKAIGTGQQTRGGLEEDTRITLYILDDPDDEDNTKTKESMEANFDKFLGGVAGLDRRNGRVIVIGTPVRQGCIVDRLKQSSEWEVRSYQAYNPTTKETLWEEMYPYEWLMSKKKEFEELGKLSKFYSEYMCQIVGEEDQLFKEEYIQYYEGHLDAKQDGGVLHITKINDKEVELSKPVNVFIGIDPASSTKQTADYSVTMPIAYDENGNIYVLPFFRKRVTPTAHAEQIIDIIKHLKPTRGYVESVGYQEMLRQYLRQRLEEEDIYLPGLERKMNPRTEKSVRLETLHPFFYNKKVYFQKDMQEFLDELLMYPRGKHDDIIDAFYYSTRGLIKPAHTTQNADEDELKYFLRNPKHQMKGWLVA